MRPLFCGNSIHRNLHLKSIGGVAVRNEANVKMGGCHSHRVAVRNEANVKLGDFVSSLWRPGCLYETKPMLRWEAVRSDVVAVRNEANVKMGGLRSIGWAAVRNEANVKLGCFPSDRFGVRNEANVKMGDFDSAFGDPVAVRNEANVKMGGCRNVLQDSS